MYTTAPARSRTPVMLAFAFVLANQTPIVVADDQAASFAIARLSDWFAPHMVRAAADDRHSIWLTTERGMEREAQTVLAVTRTFWGERVRFSDAARPLGEGLAWYLHGRIVEELFDQRWQLRAYALDVRRYFGGFVPWELRSLPVSRLTVGIGRDVYLGRPQSRWRGNLTPAAARVALGFASLEQRLTWPVLERGLRSVAGRYDGKTIDSPAFAGVLSAAVGEDLSRFFTLLARGADLDASVTRLAAESCSLPSCVRSAVEVRASGPDALDWPLRIRFADGQGLETSWRARDGSTVWFESAAQPVMAAIDPARTNLLDRDYRDNTVVTNPATDVRVGKWSARWLVWLQNVMLTYAGFV